MLLVLRRRVRCGRTWL